MCKLEWRDEYLPVSTRFDDPYYSIEDGRAETGHVFIEGNSLTERWSNLPICIIAELGFGTGLNFIETVRQWQIVKPDDAKLTFISFEQFPMTAEDIGKALSQWPELSPLTNRLLEIWDPKMEVLDAEFCNDINLTVHMGDANAHLPNLKFEADAWYLDGFSPAKNPELWNAGLMQQVSNHTVADGTFATYSAAGFVRRSLQSAGFNVEKTDGFGSKRDMLIGTKQRDTNVADGY